MGIEHKLVAKDRSLRSEILTEGLTVEELGIVTLGLIHH
jgi:hypothetical protein